MNFIGALIFTILMISCEQESITLKPKKLPIVYEQLSHSTNESQNFNFQMTAAVGSDSNFNISTSPTNGTLNCTSSGACQYSPNLSYVGTDSFTYKISKGSSVVKVVTVLINVIDVDFPPVTIDITPTDGVEDIETMITLSYTDADSDLANACTISNLSNLTISTACICDVGGVCTVGVTGSPNHFGAVSFDYTVEANGLISNTSSANFSLSAVNDPPVLANNQTFNIDDQVAFDFTIDTATDVDIPAQTLSYKIISGPSSGAISNCIDNLSFQTDRTCRFTPDPNTSGVVSFTYRAYDGIDESTSDATVSFNITDLTPSPTPNIILASDPVSNSTSVSVTNQSCTDIADLYISESPIVPVSGSTWQSCNTTAGGLSLTVSSVNEIKTIYVFSRDTNGNIQTTPGTVQMTFDNVAPTISLNVSNVQKNQTYDISFYISELHTSSAQNISVLYDNGTTSSPTSIAMINGPLSNEEFSVSITSPNLDGQALQLQISFTDLAGNTTVVADTFYSDSIVPVISSFSLNSGVTTSGNNSVLSSLEAVDANSNITNFCFKYNDPSPPSANDSCWVAVDAPSPGVAAAPSISFSNYYYRVGFIQATYDVYAWVKDEAENISVNGDSIGVDKFQLMFDPGSAPRITDLETTNSDTPNIPNTSSDLIVSSGGNVYIKWNAVDLEGLSANPISIYYTIDDVNYLPFISAQDIPNGVNGSCSIDARFSGCTVVSAPASTYFKIRVVAKDLIDSVVFFKSDSMNEPNVRVIAGNSEDGIGASATTAVFRTNGATSTINGLYRYKLVMTNNGKFFYADAQKGLLWVNPENGVLDILVPDTGVISGNGGAVSSATVADVQAIALDRDDNIIIWDHNTIRKIDLSTMTITHLVGGGALVEPTVTVDANQIALSPMDGRLGTLITLPNGDIIFSDTYASFTKRRYRASDQKVEPMKISGVGVGTYSTDIWNTAYARELGVAYDKATGQINYMMQSNLKVFTGDSYPLFTRIDHNSGSETTDYTVLPPYDISLQTYAQYTGQDGEIYLVNRFRTSIEKYDYSTNTITRVLGAGGTSVTGFCPDGTDAMTCGVDIDSVFISSTGQIFFVDQGAIRTIDASGNLITIFGQDKSFGNGGLAKTARIGNLVAIQQDKAGTSNNNLIVFDGNSHELRSFETGSTISKLTDLGYSWHGPYRFEVNTINGDLFAPTAFSGSLGLGRFDRATGTWLRVVGGGATQYHSGGDGEVGLDIGSFWYSVYTNGFVNDKLIYTTYAWSGSYSFHLNTKIYDTLDSYRQSHFLGTIDYATTVTPGAPLATQEMEPTNIEYFQDPNDSIDKYFFGRLGGTEIYTGEVGGDLNIFAALGSTINAFTYKLTGGLKIYFCAAENGRLYEYEHATATKSLLNWNSPSLSCNPGVRTIIYNDERNSIIFAGKENGFDVIGEYSL